jgi:alkaline phosphatase D
MIKDDQMAALLDWINDGPNRVKMIVTSVPIAPDLSSDSDDKWNAFPEQRKTILDAIAAQQNKKFVFVSGDVHCSYTAEIRHLDDQRLIANQVVSSSFFWPYPHMERGEILDNKPLAAPDSENPEYIAKLTSDVVSDDNFVRMDIAPEKMDVSFYKRKGGLIGSREIRF